MSILHSLNGMPPGLSNQSKNDSLVTELLHLAYSKRRHIYQVPFQGVTGAALRQDAVAACVMFYSEDKHLTHLGTTLNNLVTLYSVCRQSVNTSQRAKL